MILDADQTRSLLTVVGFFVTIGLAWGGSYLLFRYNMSRMPAQNRADDATTNQKYVEMTEQMRELYSGVQNELVELRQMVGGQIRFSGEFSMQEILKHGYAPIENGRVEILKPSTTVTKPVDTAHLNRRT